MSEQIVIACAANEAYVPHAATMLTSLFLSNPDNAFSIHLFHDSMASTLELDKLVKWVNGTTSHQIHLHCPDTAIPPNLPINARFSIAAWFRVLLPQLLPDEERVLYLDVDLLIRADILALWQTPLESNLVAAATNPFYPNMDMNPIYKLGLAEPAEYFNSGVMLMNLAALRKTNLAKTVFDFATQNHWALRFADQDPLNYALYESVCFLDTTWNAQSSYFDLNKKTLARMGAFINPPDFDIDKAAIVHFSGPWKPWDFACRHPLRKEYWRYRRNTPWDTKQLSKATPYQVFLKFLPTAHQVQLSIRLNNLHVFLKRLKYIITRK